MSAALLKRLRAMNGAELRFRTAAAVRSRVERARTALAPPAWRRESLRLGKDPALGIARGALARQDWHAAHVALAAHFVDRATRFPLVPRELRALGARITAAFPDASGTERAERVLQGRYDLLGYRDVHTASPPDWHADPVHGLKAPLTFWESVPYLDPSCGDHKITWELNRHQHFLVLGRAYARTGDERFYHEFVSQITDWIRHNPPLLGTNWASMLECAFRTLSWVWALHFFVPAAGAGDREPWIVDLLMALDRQLDHVEQNLSRYFSPNTHLTGEALALYVAGRALPELARSAPRETTGRNILLEEAHRQVLRDGAHAERSAHYHRYSTDFYLLALNIAQVTGDPAQDAFRETATRQARVLRTLADETGRLPLLGDDDGGQLFPICGRPPADCSDSLGTASLLLRDRSLATGTPPEEAWWLCAALPPALEAGSPPPGSTALRDSGYYVSRNGRGDHLIFDCGPHGFLNGGHAHSDALAVVLTIQGTPFLIDPGTATYTMDPARRDRFRSTAMHNTVVVNGRPQSIPAGPFHWKSRTDSECTAWRSAPDRDYIAGRHEAYAPIVHSREVLAVHGTGWAVVDHLSGEGHVQASAMWHIHPAWSLEKVEGNVATLHSASGLCVTLTTSNPVEPVTADGLDEYAPEYGRIEKCLCLQSTVAGPLPRKMAAFIVASTVHLP